MAKRAPGDVDTNTPPRRDPFRAAAVVAAVVLLASIPMALGRLGPLLSDDPIKGFALAAAVFALATTPVAFAVLGRMDWFMARRGRVYMRPEFWSVCAGMALVMGIPAVFAAMVVKSDKFDKDRYEFDPNKTWSVLEQGRGLATVREADAAVKVEMESLAGERKKLVDGMRKLDESMLALRAASGTSAAVAQTIPDVLQRLAVIRRAVGLDGPQQLMDFTAPPADLRGTGLAANAAPSMINPGPAPAMPTASTNTPPAAAVATAGALPRAVADAEVAGVPSPQQKIAAMLPLADLPPGWTVGKSGTKHLETFSAQNLFEKIDGRAESFIQFDVKGMAYAYFHPAGDESNEVQLYIFEMSSPLNALGKYGAEKPDDAKGVPVGAEGYTAAGSTLFYAGPYYTQIVSTKDDAKFAAFALELAKGVAAKQKAPEQTGAVAGGAVKAATSSPEALFALLPAAPGRGTPKYVKEDVFGYSFLSQIFMADYKEGEAGWQGFLRPYPTPEAAKAVFDKYLASAKQDGAQVTTLAADGADQFALINNIGMADAVFRRGNVLGGANGATEKGQPAPAKSEAFARSLVNSLPASLPPLDSEPDAGKPAEGEASSKEEKGSAEGGSSDQ